MKARHEPGLPFTIPFAIPTFWTPGQALAVFELLDDLRCPIFAHYQNWLFHETPENRHPDIDRYHNTTIDDPAMYRKILIPAYWTVEEAFAVFQLLDLLHEKIWAIYHSQLQDAIAKPNQSDKIVDPNPDYPPF